MKPSLSANLFKSDFVKAAIALVCFRFISAFTANHFYHPDEWTQTVEFGRILQGTFGLYTDNLVMHLRNLSWPWALAQAMNLSDWVAGDSVFWRSFSIHFFSGLFDLGALWGMFRFLSTLLPTPLIRWWWFIYLLLPFSIIAGPRPSQEHISGCLFWIALGLFQFRRTPWILLASIMSVGIGAVKPAAFLLTAGQLGFELWKSLRERNPSRSIALVVGTVLGLLLFGLADWVYYGRPWESLWMYFHFNIISGYSHKIYGAQSASEFFSFFKEQYKGIALLLAPLFLLGWLRVLRASQKLPNRKVIFSVVIPTALYLIAHLLVSHKEPRFMKPIAWPLAIIGFVGIAGLFHRYRKTSIVYFSVMAVFALRSLWGYTWQTPVNLLEAQSHLKQTPHTCALISQHRPMSALLPRDYPAWGYWSKQTLVWLEHKPTCNSNDSILFQPIRPMSKAHLTELMPHCQILKSGVLKAVPKSKWEYFLSQPGWVAAPWYQCDSSVLSFFQTQEVRNIFVSAIVQHDTLPGIDETSQLFLKWNEVYPGVHHEGSMPDL